MSILAIFSVVIVVTVFTPSYGTNFEIVNQCSYTVWAATTTGEGKPLEPGESWLLTVIPNSATARIWGRTNCNFDANGQGQCDSGNCNGGLVCQGNGTSPATLVGLDGGLVHISLVNGFNLPVDLSPTTNVCKGIRCAADIISQCPAELKAPGGCNSPCTAFKTSEYCCNDDKCSPTTYSKFFKYLCPDAYIHPLDDANGTIACPADTDYNVTFCP